MKLILALLMAFALYGQTYQLPPVNGSGNANWIPCVGTPGNTAGPAGSICVVPATGAAYGCKAASPATCATSSDWAAINGSAVDINTLAAASYCPDTSVAANAITCNTSTAFMAYATGQTLIVHVAIVNTGATTITVNSIAGGGKAVTKFGSTALAAGNLIVTDYAMTYDGTRFQVLNPTLIAADIPSLSYQAPLTNYSTISALTGYPSTFTPPAATASTAGGVTLAATAQKFFGTTAPSTGITGNLPGDLYTDTTHHQEYVCNAPSGTAAPACTAVATAGWLLLNANGIPIVAFNPNTATALT